MHERAKLQLVKRGDTYLVPKTRATSVTDRQRLLARRGTSRLASGPGGLLRATPFLPQHARRPPIFLRWHEHLQLFINSFERHALTRRGFPLSGAF